MMANTKNRDHIADSELAELNTLTAKTLGLDDRDQALIEDFMNVRATLTRGKVTASAIGRPTRPEVESYAETLRDELDAFIHGELGAVHSVSVASQHQTSVVRVQLTRGESAPQPVKIAHTKLEIDREYALALQHLSSADSQWSYFRRDLQIHTESRTYLFKPFERLHWTRTQAILDASELLAEMVTPKLASELGHA